MLKSNSTLKYSSVYIPEVNNTCHKINNNIAVMNHNSNNPCTVIAVIECEGNIECEYAISFLGQNSHKLLKEK
jgi:hypothetical protein